MKINKILGILVAVSILGNIILSYFIASNPSAGNIKSNESSDHTQFPYLSLRIFSEDQNDILINFLPLRDAIRTYIAKQSDDTLGIYFEYLPSGNSIGVNDKMEVRLASLIKIPVIMAVYKQIEFGKLSKNQTLIIQQEHINKEFGDLWKRGVGTSISLKEAVDLALKKSDNTAADLLTATLPEGAIDHVFDSLDIPKDKQNNLPIISPKNYSSILRSLYLASYLTKDHSNEILEVLTQTDFKDTISSDIPSSIPIAHKIGVYNQPGKETIFSDCGIVFVPKRPYIYCIMTDANQKQANQYLQFLSKMIFGYITAVNHVNAP